MDTESTYPSKAKASIERELLSKAKQLEHFKSVVPCAIRTTDYAVRLLTESCCNDLLANTSFAESTQRQMTKLAQVYGLDAQELRRIVYDHVARRHFMTPTSVRGRAAHKTLDDFRNTYLRQWCSSQEAIEIMSKSLDHHQGKVGHVVLDVIKAMFDATSPSLSAETYNAKDALASLASRYNTTAEDIVSAVYDDCVSRM